MAVSNVIGNMVEGLLRGHQLGMQLKRAQMEEEAFKTRQALDQQAMTTHEIMNEQRARQAEEDIRSRGGIEMTNGMIQEPGTPQMLPGMIGPLGQTPGVLRKPGGEGRFVTTVPGSQGKKQFELPSVDEQAKIIARREGEGQSILAAAKVRAQTEAQRTELQNARAIRGITVPEDVRDEIEPGITRALPEEIAAARQRKLDLEGKTLDVKRKRLIDEAIERGHKAYTSGQQHPIDVIFPASLDQQTHDSYKANYDHAASMMPDANGRYPALDSIAAAAASHAAAMRMEMSPTVRQGKADTAVAIENAKIPSDVRRATAIEYATNPIKTARAINTAKALRMGDNPAVAGVAPMAVAKVQNDAIKLDQDQIKAGNNTETLGKFLDLIERGNKAAGANLPLVGVETINAIKGIKRMNEAEIKQYGNVGNAWDKFIGKLDSVVEGKPFPQNILNDVREMHQVIGEQSWKDYTSGLKSLNDRTNAKYLPNVDPPNIRKPATGTGAVLKVTHMGHEFTWPNDEAGRAKMAKFKQDQGIKEMPDSVQELAAKYGATVTPAQPDVQALAKKYGATVTPTKDDVDIVGEWMNKPLGWQEQLKTLGSIVASPITSLVNAPVEVYNWIKRGGVNPPSGGHLTEEPITQAYGNAAMAFAPVAENAIKASPTAIKGAVKGGAKAAVKTAPVSFKGLTLNVPVAATSAATGAGVAETAGRAFGVPPGLAGAVGGVVGGGIPITRGMIEGAKEALAARAARGADLRAAPAAPYPGGYSAQAPAPEAAPPPPPAPSGPAPVAGEPYFVGRGPVESVSPAPAAPAAPVPDPAMLEDISRSLSGKGFSRLTREEQAGVRTIAERLSSPAAEPPAAPPAAPPAPAPAPIEQPAAPQLPRTLSDQVDEYLASQRAAEPAAAPAPIPTPAPPPASPGQAALRTASEKAQASKAASRAKLTGKAAAPAEPAVQFERVPEQGGSGKNTPPQEQPQKPEGGKPEADTTTVYHGTPHEFSDFEQRELGTHFGTLEQAQQRLADLKSPSGRIISARIKPTANLIDMADLGSFNYLPDVLSSNKLRKVLGGTYMDKIAEARQRAMASLQSKYREWDPSAVEFRIKPAEHERWVADKRAWDQSQFAKIRADLIAKGYEGIRYQNAIEGHGYSYDIFDPAKTLEITPNESSAQQSSAAQPRPQVTPGRDVILAGDQPAVARSQQATQAAGDLADALRPPRTGEEAAAHHRPLKAARYAEALQKGGIKATDIGKIEDGYVSPEQIQQGVAPRWGNIAESLGEDVPSPATIKLIKTEMNKAKLRPKQAPAAAEAGAAEAAPVVQQPEPTPVSQSAPQAPEMVTGKAAPYIKKAAQLEAEANYGESINGSKKAIEDLRQRAAAFREKGAEVQARESAVEAKPAPPEPWQMTRAEFIRTYPERTRASIQQEVSRKVAEIEPQIADAQHRLASDPGNPANGQIRAWIEDAQTRIAEQKDRLAAPIQPIEQSWSPEQIRWHHVEFAVRKGKPVSPEVLADYPDLQKQAQSAGVRRSALNRKKPRPK